MKLHQPIPADFAVQPLRPGQHPKGEATCGHCGLSWDDDIPTSYTPAPAARCPFEYFHLYEMPERKQQYVVCSEQERGFWSNDQGWVFDVASAARYTNRARLRRTLPSIGVPDCRIIVLQNARDYSPD